MCSKTHTIKPLQVQMQFKILAGTEVTFLTGNAHGKCVNLFFDKISSLLGKWN